MIVILLCYYYDVHCLSHHVVDSQAVRHQTNFVISACDSIHSMLLKCVLRHSLRSRAHIFYYRSQLFDSFDSIHYSRFEDRNKNDAKKIFAHFLAQSYIISAFNYY
jgi:hypothetical protein